MELHIYFAFVISTAVMISLPGPSVLLTVAHSITFGWQRALATVAGATMGVAVQLMVVTIGFASLLNSVANAFEWLRWCGAAYLVYLGVKQWRTANKPLDFDTSSVSRMNLFIQGLAVTIPNPKSLIFIAAFLPQFIDASRPVGIQLSFIIPTFLIITFTVTAIWALAAGKASGFLKSKRAVKFALRTTGGLMVASGIGLALSRRGS